MIETLLHYDRFLLDVNRKSMEGQGIVLAELNPKDEVDKFVNHYFE